MDRSKFSPASPGRLVPIQQPKRDWAFVPNDMPPLWTFDARLWPLVAEARDRLGTLNGIGQTLPDQELLLRPLQSREAISSSNIEGTFVTPEQLLLYELDPREPRTGDEQMADWFEVANYNNALRKGCELLKTLPICNRVIKSAHAELMRGVRGRSKGPGDFRKWQVQIGSSGRFIPPPAPEAERLMSDLERYINSDDSRYDPLVRAYLVHYQFETIHPFGDGNGRVGRLLLALMIYKALSHSQPWLYMSAFFEKFKDEYMTGLFNISTRGAWTEWIEFCLNGTISQANDAIRRCNDFNRLYDEFKKKADAPNSRTHLLIDYLFASPIVSVTSLAKRFDIQYHTAKSDLDRLVEAGILRELDDHRPKSYYAPDIMRIAYGDANDEAAIAPSDVPSEPKSPSAVPPPDLWNTSF